MRAAEKAAQDGGARRRPRHASRSTRRSPSGPAQRSQQLTGLPARITGGRLELHFGDETGLAELVETLEALRATRRVPGARPSVHSSTAGD